MPGLDATNSRPAICPTIDLDHLTVAGNWGSTASAYFLAGSVRHSIFQQNQGRGIYTKVEVLGDHNAYFANQTAGAWPVGWEDPTDLFDDALFVDFTALADGYGQDLHLTAASTMIDAGTAAVDPDGSLEDLGAYGGAFADPTYDDWYGDLDGDGLPDGWEAEMGLVDGVDGDAADDPDGDGISNLAEYGLGTHPKDDDTDGDGVTDNAELIALTDPTDPGDNRPVALAGLDIPGTVGLTSNLDGSSSYDPNFDLFTYAWAFAAVPGRSTLTDLDLLGADQANVGFTPDTPGTFELQLVVNDGAADSVPDIVRVVVSGDVMVPGDYPSIAQAVDNVEMGYSVIIAAGTWPLNLDLNGIDLSLIGAGEALTFIDGEHTDQIIVADDGESVALSNLTLMNGIGALGAAVMIEGGDLTISDVTLQDNDGVWGGALYVYGGTCVATGITVVDNTSAHYGGGAYFELSAIDTTQSLFAGNFVADVHGGAIYTYGADLNVSNTIFADNDGVQGGALLLTGSTSDNDAPLDDVAAVELARGRRQADRLRARRPPRGRPGFLQSVLLVRHCRDREGVQLDAAQRRGLASRRPGLARLPRQALTRYSLESSRCSGRAARLQLTLSCADTRRRSRRGWRPSAKEALRRGRTPTIAATSSAVAARPRGSPATISASR